MIWIWDFTGVGVLLGLFLAVFGLLIFALLSLIVCLFQKNKNHQALFRPSAYGFLC